MQLPEARLKFIEAWGAFGSAWGISRTMAQVHALLLIATEPLTTDDVMDQLNISRGNANMNLRALIDWGLISKVLRSGDRKDYFEAEKDVWRIATQITRERKKRELEPMLKLLTELKRTEGTTSDAKAFRAITTDLQEMTSRVDAVLERTTRSDMQWFLKAASNLLR